MSEISSVEKTRVLYLDFLRILSIIAVITMHTSALLWNKTDVNTPYWQVFNFYDSFVRWAVPVFVMISGSLFLDPARKISLKQLFSKNILRMVRVYFLWSALYACVHLLSEQRLKSASIEFLAHFIKGHYHLWFLYMIVGLYLITPLLRCMIKSREMIRYYLLLSLVFTFLIPTILCALQTVDILFAPPQQTYKVGLYDFGNSVYEQVRFYLTLGYSPYYVAGYYLSRRELNKRWAYLIYIMGAVGFLSTFFFTSIVSRHENEAISLFYAYDRFNVFFESIAVFVFVKRATANGILELAKKLISGISKYVFGVYLIHVLVLSAFTRYIFDVFFIHPILSVPLISLCVFIISALLSIILNKIPIVRKYCL